MEFDDNSKDYIRHQYYIQDIFLRRRRQSIWLLIAASIFATLFWICASLIPPVRGILKTQETILQCQASGMSKIPQLEEKIDSMEKRLALAASTSLDARIQAVERALQVNSLNSDDITTLNTLRNEMLMLKGYLFDDPNEVIAFKQLQSDYRALSARESQFATKEFTQSQIATLQTILTVSLTFFGILFTVFFGSWWFIGRKTIPSTTPTTPVSSEK